MISSPATDDAGVCMIKVFPDDEAVAYGAANLFFEQFKKSQEKSKRFSVALSGGRTPKRTFEHLAGPDFKEKIDWNMVHVFWGDERCVPLDDPRSNFKMTQDALLSKVDIPVDQVHPILCMQEPYQGAIDYELTLRDFFDDDRPSFDLVFLGLGTDGHTASLFPNSIALEEKMRWTSCLQNPTDDFARITLTPQILNLSQLTVFLVTGKEKKEILEKVLRPKAGDQEYPSQLIKPENGELTWLVDQAAYSPS
jgi:6-phosphogluconolactonase